MAVGTVGTVEGAGDSGELGVELAIADTDAFATTELVDGIVVVTTPLLAAHLHPRPRFRLRVQRLTWHVALSGSHTVLALSSFPQQTSAQGECRTEMDKTELERKHSKTRSARGMRLRTIIMVRCLKFAEADGKLRSFR